MGLGHLQLSGNRSHLFYWEACSVLVVFFVGHWCCLVPPLLLRLFLLLFSFFSLLRGLRPGTGACILLSLSPLSLLTTGRCHPTPTPPPLPPMTPVLGNVNTFFAKSKCWALARSPFLTLLFLLLFSVLLSRDTDQGSRPLTPHCAFVSVFFFSPFRRSRPLVFSFSPLC